MARQKPKMHISTRKVKPGEEGWSREDARKMVEAGRKAMGIKPDAPGNSSSSPQTDSGEEG